MKIMWGNGCGRKILTVFLVLLGLVSKSQDFPNTDIFLLNISCEGDNVLVQSKPVNITKRYGYDNQPSFTLDGKKILFSSVGEDNQSDIFVYHLEKKKTEQLTYTPESEFSPEVMDDKKSFSVVMVEEDSTQRIWKYPLYGHNTPMTMMQHVDSIGYYSWFYKELLAYFKITDPPTLEIVVTDRQKPQVVAENIGRCIRKIPNELAVSFLDKSREGDWRIKKVDTGLQVHEIARNWSTSEDHCWTPNGILLATYYDRIYALKPGGEWKVIAELDKYEMCEMTRIAVSPDGTKLAVVNLMSENE